MGIDYSTGSGYGFIIPESFIENIEAQHEDDDYWDGFSMWLENTLDATEGVTYLTGGSYYSGDLSYAIIARGTGDSRDLYGDEGGISYVDDVDAVRKGVNPDNQLRRTAHIIGIEEEVKLGWLESFLIS